MALLPHDLALPGQFPQHGAAGLPQLGVPHLPPGLWDSPHHGTLHSPWVWATLSLSSLDASWDRVRFARCPAYEAFVVFQNCHTRGVARQSRGVTERT